MYNLFKNLIVIVSIIFVFSLPSVIIAADNYPTKPITMIVPYGAGGSSDIHARIFAQSMEKYLGQPVVVQNIPKAGGLAGHLELMKSPTDGYTVGMLSPLSIVTLQHMFSEGPSLNKYESIALMVPNSYLLGVSQKSGFKNLKEVVSFGKKNPKKLLVAINPGSGSHLTTVNMFKAMGVEPTYVPAKSSSQRRTAVAGGHLDMTVDTFASLRSMIDAKKINAVAISSDERYNKCPDVPTFLEQGVNYVYTGWNGIYVKKGASEQIIQTLRATVKKLSADQEVIDKLKKSGHNFKVISGVESNKILHEIEVSYAPVIKELGLEKVQ